MYLALSQGSDRLSSIAEVATSLTQQISSKHLESLEEVLQ